MGEKKVIFENQSGCLEKKSERFEDNFPGGILYLPICLYRRGTGKIVPPYTV
jgi:hypothetical protein